MQSAIEGKMEGFLAFLSEAGLKCTRQRRAIARVFYESGEHLSLQELLERSKELESSIGYATVYRTMRLLAEGGLASEHQFGDGSTRYEPVEDGEHHDHLICVDCGKIFEFEDDDIEALQERVALARGLRVQSHRHEIYAVCVDTECEWRAR